MQRPGRARARRDLRRRSRLSHRRATSGCSLTRAPRSRPSADVAVGPAAGAAARRRCGSPRVCAPSGGEFRPARGCLSYRPRGVTRSPCPARSSRSAPGSKRCWRAGRRPPEPSDRRGVGDHIGHGETTRQPCLRKLGVAGRPKQSPEHGSSGCCPEGAACRGGR
jgi:hypothetical protein